MSTEQDFLDNLDILETEYTDTGDFISAADDIYDTLILHDFDASVLTGFYDMVSVYTFQRGAGRVPLQPPSGGMFPDPELDPLAQIKQAMCYLLYMQQQLSALIRNLVNQRALKCYGAPANSVCCALAKSTLTNLTTSIFNKLQEIGVARQTALNALLSDDPGPAINSLYLKLNELNTLINSSAQTLNTVLACTDDS